jgi:hypothetical protein
MPKNKHKPNLIKLILLKNKLTHLLKHQHQAKVHKLMLKNGLRLMLLNGLMIRVW